jgi:3-deoxy-manno-octulosonate cytidylyltransferase (CMP-KDO synthetase)
MKIIGIIPARYASTRFPGKPLVDISGKTMIQRVYEQAKKATSLAEVIVATDDRRIYDHVSAFGGTAVMTKESHLNGTERCNEVAMARDCDVVVNIQGDEPFINPFQIEQVAACFDSPGTDIATLAKKENDLSVLQLPGIVKVVFNADEEALYFSRSVIPFVRNTDAAGAHDIFYKHIGIYAYRKAILEKLVVLPVGKLESLEMLEQLRWLENGYKIKLSFTSFESISVDVPEDLKRLPL